jgi:plastocyanin
VWLRLLVPRGGRRAELRRHSLKLAPKAVPARARPIYAAKTTPFRALCAATLASLLVPGAALAADQTVQATSADTFVQSDVTVNVGEKVTWTNMGGLHNVVFDDGMFTQPGSPALPAAWPATVSRTFPAAGTFTYYCAQHRSIGMTGVVHVVAVGGSPPGGTPSPPGGGSSPGGGSGGGSTGGGSPGSGSPKKTPFKVTLRTGRSKGKARFSGTVRPAQDGRLVLIQVRVRGARYKTVAKARLKRARGNQSVFSVRLRVTHAGVFRAQVLGAGSHSTGTSGTRRVRPA